MVYLSWFLLLLFVNSIMSSVTVLFDDDCEDNFTMNYTDEKLEKSRNEKSLAIRSLSENRREETSRASSGVSYQEFLINEASYKFWAIFQLVTVAVLLYSTFAAIYYARYNYLMNLESGNYDDLLFARSLPTFGSIGFPALDVQTFQRIVDAVFQN